MAESFRPGIKTRNDFEDKRFMRFFDIVQDAAAKQDCTFFLDCGEGNELETDSLSGEDLFGWLVSNSDVPEFEPLWLIGWSAIGDSWEEEETFVRWSVDDGKVDVRFEPALT